MIMQTHSRENNTVRKKIVNYREKMITMSQLVKLQEINKVLKY